jgi:beta-fructofuranosidase
LAATGVRFLVARRSIVLPTEAKAEDGGAGAGGRPRPAAHFTPRRGWMNDPYGVWWDGGTYHMCYQAVPDRTVWSPACAWGHAVSGDLVSWEERGLVLVPQPQEVGCWSGCVVADAPGSARAFYTRVQSDDLDLGSIAVARCDPSGRLVSGPGDVVVAGPPPTIPVSTFRDPYVWREGQGWTMIVGGAAEGDGVVLQYRSDDLDHWRSTGVLCRGRVPGGDDRARQGWECPQMMDVQGRWALIVSVQSAGQAGHVAAATGSYDGARFVPHRWDRLAFGAAPYATSAFRDRNGRPCVMSWLQEDPQHPPGASEWAGAQSLVSVLAVDDDGRVTATPHPALAGSPLFAHHTPGSWPWVQESARSTPARATRVTAPAGAPVAVEVRGTHRPPVTVTRSGARDGLVIDRPGRPTEVIPCPHPSAGVDLFIDADILEIFSGGVYGAWRIGV